MASENQLKQPLLSTSTSHSSANALSISNNSAIAVTNGVTSAASNRTTDTARSLASSSSSVDSRRPAQSFQTPPAWVYTAFVPSSWFSRSSDLSSLSLNQLQTQPVSRYDSCVARIRQRMYNLMENYYPFPSISSESSRDEHEYEFLTSSYPADALEQCDVPIVHQDEELDAHDMLNLDQHSYPIRIPDTVDNTLSKRIHLLSVLASYCLRCLCCLCTGFNPIFVSYLSNVVMPPIIVHFFSHLDLTSWSTFCTVILVGFMLMSFSFLRIYLVDYAYFIVLYQFASHCSARVWASYCRRSSTATRLLAMVIILTSLSVTALLISLHPYEPGLMVFFSILSTACITVWLILIGLIWHHAEVFYHLSARLIYLFRSQKWNAKQVQAEIDFIRSQLLLCSRTFSAIYPHIVALGSLALIVNFVFLCFFKNSNDNSNAAIASIFFFIQEVGAALLIVAPLLIMSGVTAELSVNLPRQLMRDGSHLETSDLLRVVWQIQSGDPLSISCLGVPITRNVALSGLLLPAASFVFNFLSSRISTGN